MKGPRRPNGAGACGYQAYMRNGFGSAGTGTLGRPGRRPRRGAFVAAAILVSALGFAAPSYVFAQTVSSGGASAGSGSFGRISGGGGSYGSLTLGVTAEDLGPRRVPINVRSMADGTANTVQEGPWERVPINVQTMADGTANELRLRDDELRREDRRRRLARPVGRLPYAYLIPSTRRGSSGRAEAPGAYEPEEAGRPVPPVLRPPPPSRRAALRAPDLAGRAGTLSPVERRAVKAAKDRPGIAPRVPPPTPAADGLVLSPEECVEVRITTAGGIQWRQRVARSDFDAETPAEVAARLQATVDRGDPLSIRGPDGSFNVRAGLVDGLVVGPCRGP